MSSEEVLPLLRAEFGCPFTSDQEHAALLLSRFVCTPHDRAACLLRGYAGTGKTSLVGALV